MYSSVRESTRLQEVWKVCQRLPVRLGDPRDRPPRISAKCGSRPEFCPPDRTALRCVSHRFPHAYPVRSPVQAARLYDWRRQIPDDAIPRLGRFGNEKRIRTPNRDDDDHRLYPHRSSAAAADSPVQCQRQCGAFVVHRDMGRSYYRQHRRVFGVHLQRASRGRFF